MQRLDKMLNEIAAENDWQIVAREVMSDHLHINVWVWATDRDAEVERKLRGPTSRLLRAELPWLARRKVLWSKS